MMQRGVVWAAAASSIDADIHLDHLAPDMIRPPKPTSITIYGPRPMCPSHETASNHEFTVVESGRQR